MSAPPRPLNSESSSRANTALAVLFVVFVFNSVDRQIINILLESIKLEFEFSDTAIAFLAGPAFAIFYTLVGVPFARLAERYPRRWIIVGGLAAWSLLTAAQGAVRSFAQFAVVRILVGVGEASASPASHSIISDYFPPERRSTALAIFLMGGHVGMIGLVIGGFIDDAYGWRTAFFVVGIPGFFFSLIVPFLLKEPRRGASDGMVEGEGKAVVPPLSQTLRFLAGQRAYLHLAFAAALYVLANYGFNVWGPTFLRRVHGMSASDTGLSFGLSTALAGAIGTVVAGALCDRLSRRDVRWNMWLPALGAVGMVPLSLGFLFAPTPTLALLCFAPSIFLLTFHMPPTFSQTQGLAQLRMRATASAVLLLVINILGMAVGPQVVGIASDLLLERHGEESLRYAMLIFPVAAAWGALHSMLAARTLRADLARAAAASAAA